VGTLARTSAYRTAPPDQPSQLPCPRCDAEEVGQLSDRVRDLERRLRQLEK
jgi:hypothetical protein